MHEQDWQAPLKFDWSGKNGPPLTEEDIHNSVISRILRNDFHAPFEQREYVRQTPWWNPQDPLGQNLNYRSTAYIPGKQQTPQYPQLSTLAKRQHLLVLRVLSTKYGVQPWDYHSPTPDDFGSFEKLKELYEKEQSEYRLWARTCWVNGDCIRTLHPKALLETVYEAQFELKKIEIHTLPHNFIMAAQISLETKVESFELQPIKELKSVCVKSLPVVDYPDVLEHDVSVLRPYTVPKPCHRHSSRFVLPHENSVSELPLPEVYRELAQYASENGAAIIASESALQCILDTERRWMLPLSVVEVISPDGGNVKTVVVLGSEFSVQKECGALRTFKAFRHLLRNSFTISNETSKTHSPTHQPASKKQPDLFHSRDDDQTNSSDEEQLKIDVDVIEQRQRATESPHISYNVTNNRTNSGTSCSTRPNRRTEDPGCSSIETKLSVLEKPRTNDTEKAFRHLRNTFKESTENSNTNSSTQQPASTKHPDWFHSREDDQNYSSDEEQLKIDIDVIEQRQHSTKSPHMAYNVTNNSNGTSNAETPSSSGPYLSTGSMTHDSDLEKKKEVSFTSNSETYVSPNLSVYSNEAIKAVPQKVQKQIHVAGMYIEAQANDQISLDKTTLSTEAINDIIGVNPSSREDMDDIICDIKCTCKGTTYEVPPPRSFKKWQVKNAASNLSFDLIIHSSHKAREGEKEVILEPIVEWQPELGACKQSAGRLRALALSLTMRPKAELFNVRVDYNNGNIIVIDKLDEKKFMRWHGDKRSEIAGRIHTAIDQLRFLKQGQYVLAHNTSHGANAMVYSTLAAGAAVGFAGSGDHTLSLRPASDTMSAEEEATLAKIPPELSRAMLPYHKDQGILPLAFTPDKNHVKDNKTVTAALAKASVTPQANQRRRKNKRKRKKKQPSANAN